jgi:hypothetical protein
MPKVGVVRRAVFRRISDGEAVCADDCRTDLWGECRLAGIPGANDWEQEELIKMQQIRLQGATARSLLAFSLFTFLAVEPAFGQAHAVRVEIPYAFTVGSKALPAGTYTFSLAVDSPAWVEVKVDAATAARARIVTRLGGPTEFQDGSLVFDKSDGTRVLSEVWIPGVDGILVHATPKGHSHDILMTSGLGSNLNLSGKAAFDRTCRKCHGPEGAGEERADKFFNTAIPRLGSADVQSKSEAELKEIITAGKRGMPPVEIDEAGFRHRLPPELVDSVIAYVRTLKR